MHFWTAYVCACFRFARCGSNPTCLGLLSKNQTETQLVWACSASLVLIWLKMISVVFTQPLFVVYAVCGGHTTFIIAERVSQLDAIIAMQDFYHTIEWHYWDIPMWIDFIVVHAPDADE